MHANIITGAFNHLIKMMKNEKALVRVGEAPCKVKLDRKRKRRGINVRRQKRRLSDERDFAVKKVGHKSVSRNRALILMRKFCSSAKSHCT